MIRFEIIRWCSNHVLQRTRHRVVATISVRSHILSLCS